MKERLKKVIWVGSFKKDLMKLPLDVINDIGSGLYQTQLGKMPDSGKICQCHICATCLSEKK